MPKIVYIDYEGVEREVDAAVDDSLMQTAKNNSIPGIDAECGGACVCATCHVYIDLAFRDCVGSPNPAEAEMLEFVAGLQPNSRLSCQITVTDSLTGLIVRTPKTQQ
jgi:2Fe-2S ferredoxin